MGKFIINGYNRLSGEISVGGSKNAALPIIFACITVHGVSRLKNLPDIGDVRVALDILRGFGAEIFLCDGEAKIDTRELYYTIPDEALVCKIRASSYLIGACLARFGRAELQSFGGCNFESRPIDMHVCAAERLGARIEENTLCVNELCGGEIVFDKISVGATVNAIIMASSAKGKSRIYGYAKEPHVIALTDFLRSAGANIEIRDEYIEIEGGTLVGADAKIIPDMIEAGTYISLALMNGADIRIKNADAEHLTSFFYSVADIGGVIRFYDDEIRVLGEGFERATVTASPYPGFPTDLQPIIAPLLAKGAGGTICEKVWKNRFGYLDELARFGVKYLYGNAQAIIFSSSLHSAEACTTDLRGGAALLITALSVEGRSVINGAEIIKRGYADIVKKLSCLGADIKEI